MTDHLATAQRWLSTAQDSRSFDHLMSAMDQIIAHLEALQASPQPATAPPAAQQCDSGYTPLPHEGFARLGNGGVHLGKPDSVAQAEGHRWLKAHDAQVAAQALKEAADWLDSFEGPGGRTSAYDRAGRGIIRLLRERAEQTKEDR